MERAFREKPTKKPSGETKDLPVCERCGKPVRVTSADYEQGELLCISCATEEDVPGVEDDDYTSRT